MIAGFDVGSGMPGVCELARDSVIRTWFIQYKNVYLGEKGKSQGFRDSGIQGTHLLLGSCSTNNFFGLNGEFLVRTISSASAYVGRINIQGDPEEHVAGLPMPAGR